MLGFPYAVVKKYGDDAGGRHAALITYYGFLSIFPLLLVAVSVLSRVLVENDALRAEMVEALVPPRLQETVDTALTSMPSSGLPLAVGLLGLLFSGTGVVFSAYETLNHVAGVPLRSRFGFVSRYARVLLMLVVVLTAGVVVAGLTVAAAALPDQEALQRVYAPTSTYAVVFLVLVGAAKLLVARPVTVRTTWLAAAAGALAVTLVLSTGGRLLARLVSNAGPVYGSFATVAGSFALLYLVSQALLYSAETAVVLHLRLWPRALDTSRPTTADVRALELLATEQERLAQERIALRLEPPDDQR
ncbi:YihY/virulence factor BrkB family protein [Humibacillus xanthopallidus]|uniref:YihY/virulence factor BrkB family protein n=1 Tax=Humibacillus xanthopallidus TaxID=412689 RepID=UPI0038502A67